jgi:tetratricopeptide (TPR) repeat protein
LFTSVAAKDNWIEIRSKNFTLVGDAGEKDIRSVATKLEQFREALKLLLPKATLEREVPTIVYVFSSNSSFRPFKPRVKDKIQDSVAGYIMERPEAMYIALTEEELGGLSPYEVIFHEYYHFVLDNNFDAPPPWLNEGLAEFYSTFKMDKNGKGFQLGAPISRHFNSFNSRSILPLEKLLNTKYGTPEFSKRNKDNIFYAQSWAFIHFLVLGNEGKRKPQFTKFVNQLNSGMSLEENFRQSFQTDYKNMENEFRAYLGKYLFPVTNYTLQNALQFESNMQSRSVSEAEVEFLLGRLLWNLGEAESAEKYLQKSIKLSPDFAPAQTLLGYMRLRQRKYDEAERFLTRAIALNSQDYLAYTYNGSLLAQQNKSEEAIKSFEQAVQLQPNIPQTHAALASYYASIGKDKQAAGSYGQAIRLAPRNPSFFYSSSIVNLRLRRGFQAALQAQTWLRLRGWDKESSPYAAFVSYFGFRQVQRKQEADQLLKLAAERLDSKIWAYSIVRYLQREITADELLKLAGTDKDKLTESHCYIGLDLKFDGKTSEALPHLQWVKDNGNRNFIEYGFAMAELEHIENAPAPAIPK